MQIRSTLWYFAFFNSTGKGRSGTYIAIDQVIDELRHNENVDVMTTISAMRESRSEMVETLVSSIYCNLEDS